MNIKDSLVNYDNIYSHLKLDSLSLLRRWNDWSRFVSSIKIADVPSLSTRLVEDMKKSSELQISKHCLGLVEEYLESLDQKHGNIVLSLMTIILNCYAFIIQSHLRSLLMLSRKICVIMY